MNEKVKENIERLGEIMGAISMINIGKDSGCSANL
jgi:hypothetical protein